MPSSLDYKKTSFTICAIGQGYIPLLFWSLHRGTSSTRWVCASGSRGQRRRVSDVRVNVSTFRHFAVWDIVRSVFLPRYLFFFWRSKVDLVFIRKRWMSKVVAEVNTLSLSRQFPTRLELLSSVIERCAGNSRLSELKSEAEMQRLDLLLGSVSFSFHIAFFRTMFV